MEALRSQIAVITDELNQLKAEIVQVKGSHATLHQTTVEANQATMRSFVDVRQKADALENKIEAVRIDTVDVSAQDRQGKKPLIKPENVEVPQFLGSMTDGRGKFLEWSEKVMDRVDIYQDNLVGAMESAEKEDEAIDAEKSLKFGVGAIANKQLHRFLKDKCTGTAGAIV